MHADKFARKSFSNTIPGLQIAWDSTSLSLLKTCPQKYYYVMVEGWVEKAERVDLIFGIYYHAALEEYDHELVRSGDHEKAVIAAVRKALTLSWHNGKPWTPDNNIKNRFTLVRSIVWYTEHFKQDNLKPIKLANGKAAVELSFRMPTELTSPDGEDYILCGHLDKVGMVGDEAWVLDRKTTKYALSYDFFKRYTPDNQMSLYDFASKVVLDIPTKGVIIDAAQIAVSFTRFQRGSALRTAAQGEEFYRDTLQWIKVAETYAAANHWPKNDTACSHYGGCPFRGVCGKTPAVRKNYLKTDFTNKDPWDPLETR